MVEKLIISILKVKQIHEEKKTSELNVKLEIEDEPKWKQHLIGGSELKQFINRHNILEVIY